MRCKKVTGVGPFERPLMRTFGKSGGGGRRGAQRSPAPVLALLSTVGHDYHVALEDVSRTGARFCAPLLPSEGESVILRADRVRVFGRVMWTSDQRCGVSFDAPIAETAVKELRPDAQVTGLSAEERSLAEQWEAGPAR